MVNITMKNEFIANNMTRLIYTDMYAEEKMNSINQPIFTSSTYRVLSTLYLSVKCWGEWILEMKNKIYRNY